jgi:hypothetical protein
VGDEAAFEDPVLEAVRLARGQSLTELDDQQSPKFWNSALEAKLLALRTEKRVYVVRKQSDVAALLAELGSWRASGEA